MQRAMRWREREKRKDPQRKLEREKKKTVVERATAEGGQGRWGWGG